MASSHSPLRLLASLYGRLELRPLPGISLYPGARVEHVLLEYEDRYGSLAEGRVIPQNFVAFDPRLAARWELLRSLTLKGSFGLYQMAPAIEESVLDNDGRTLLPERALHAVVGFEHAFSDEITLDAQLYGIRRDQLVRNGRKLWTPERGRAPILPLDLPGPFDSFGRGQTVGVELLLRHQPNRYFFGWVAYTFSRTWLDDGTEQDPYHPSPFDQTHNLIVVARVNLPWEMTLGGRFQYATGNPSPVPGTIAVVHDLGIPDVFAYQALEDPGRRPRNPDFHRLDVRLDKKFTFEQFTLGAYVEVMNVYNRLNPEIVAPGGDFRSRGTITVLPSVPFLPTFGLSGSF